MFHKQKTCFRACTPHHEYIKLYHTTESIDWPSNKFGFAGAKHDTVVNLKIALSTVAVQSGTKMVSHTTPAGTARNPLATLSKMQNLVTISMSEIWTRVQHTLKSLKSRPTQLLLFSPSLNHHTEICVSGTFVHGKWINTKCLWST